MAPDIMEHYILNDVCVYLSTWKEVHNILDGKTTFKKLSVALAGSAQVVRVSASRPKGLRWGRQLSCRFDP